MATQKRDLQDKLIQEYEYLEDSLDSLIGLKRELSDMQWEAYIDPSYRKDTHKFMRQKSEVEIEELKCERSRARINSLLMKLEFLD